MNILAALATVVLGVTTLTQPTTLKAGTRISCVMETAVNSSTAQAGDTFKLSVKDPALPSLAGAVIHGHITHVYQPHGFERAEIAFLFDTIVFSDGARVPIRAFVVSRNVVQRTATGPGAPLPPPGPVSMPNTVGPPNQSSMIWSMNMNLGGGGSSSPSQTAQTGGFAYASERRKPIVVQVGAPVTLQLASSLQTP